MGVPFENLKDFQHTPVKGVSISQAFKRMLWLIGGTGWSCCYSAWGCDHATTEESLVGESDRFSHCSQPYGTLAKSCV